ncbi:hypothetical protein GWI33_006979 [Rhynchophorus ferrugineus]|uniref:Uncharacterized protein n=1 Tax=Rhynchophorus ferrugineus TaxID=354439 RepID=A0A834MIK7_RHYFE|nr:hypothetical protein GWI33_006979 [Rhynchophorus ferrugineus]
MIKFFILLGCSLLLEHVSLAEDAITEIPQDNKLSNEMLLSIIDDIVQSKSKKIYHTIYNINQNTSICFKDYIYMKEDNVDGRSINTWREFEFTFDFPGYCCNEINTNQTSVDNGHYKTISVIFENGDRKQLPFEMFEQSPDYTIRRNVRSYCMSRLSVLNKSYFENDNSGQKKVVIKMSDTDEHRDGDVLTVVQDQDAEEEFSSNRRNQNRDDDYEDQVYEIKRAPKRKNQIGKARINSVYSEVPNWKESTLINNSPTTNTPSKIKDDNNKTLTTKENQNAQPTIELKTESSKNTDNNKNHSTLFNYPKEINTVTVHNPSNNGDLDRILLTSDQKNVIDADNKHIESTSNVDQLGSLVNENDANIKALHSEASTLSKLLSGKWVLSSLIDLGDDKIVVRGDITVMRKHQNSSSSKNEEHLDIQ